MKRVGREILWNLPHEAAVAMYALFGVVLLVAAWGIWMRVRAYRSGRPERESRTDNLRARTLDALRIGFLQQKVLEKTSGGLIHLLIYSGFIALFIVTGLVGVEYDLGVVFLDGSFYIGFKIFADTFGLVLIAGIVLSLARRHLFRPQGLTRDGDDLLQLLLLGAIGVTGFLIETVRLAATRPAAAPYSYVSNALSPLFGSMSVPALLSLHKGLWWTHMLLAFGFLASIPWNKMAHAAAAPANIFFRSARPRGALQPIPDFDGQERIGAGIIGDFSWKQLLDLDACARCGRCEEGCPAHATGKPLSPRALIHDLRARLASGAGRARGGSGAAGPEGVIEGLGILHDDVWACTTCGQCQAACPVLVEHVEKIVDMRRHLVLGTSDFPPELEQAFRNMEVFSDPWGVGPARRMEWATELGLEAMDGSKPVELIYWVGCAGAFDERSRSVALSLARILSVSGIRFGVLGPREHCCGDFARRAGNEYLFRLLARKNMDALDSTGARRIVTSCPHCYNVLRNEYAAPGAKFEVIHHSELIRELIGAGKIRPSRPVEGRTSYHDPCYLGRYNGLYEPPRRVLGEVAGLLLVEPGRSREASFCCGAGGGHLWLAEQGRRINEERAGELADLAPDIVATACPHCLYMLEEGLSAAGKGGAAVMDLAEIVARAL